MSEVDVPLPSEQRIIAAIWPTLLASAIGLLPFTIFSTFLISIADAANSGEAAVGSLRGLAGVGAVLVGVVIAPLIGRIAPGRVAGVALVLLAAATLCATVSWLPALALFCLLTGVSNAMLYPALSTAAADRFGSGPAAGRAATLVMTSQTLASTLGAPLLVLPALWWGWRGNVVAVAVVAPAIAPLLFRYGHAKNAPEHTASQLGYLAAFRTLAGIPGAVALLLVSFGRAGALMGHLAFLAPLYGDRFGLPPTMFSFVWGLSGASFFLGHLIAGRLLNANESDHKARRVMALCLLTALICLIGVYLAPALPLALLATAVLSASHAVVAAAVLTLLVRRCPDVRGTALSLNSVAMSLGLSLGSASAGAGLALAGYLGAAAVLSGLTVLSLGAALTLRTRPR